MLRLPFSLVKALLATGQAEDDQLPISDADMRAMFDEAIDPMVQVGGGCSPLCVCT
jgi:hypothetical protein